MGHVVRLEFRNVVKEMVKILEMVKFFQTTPSVF